MDVSCDAAASRQMILWDDKVNIISFYRTESPRWRRRTELSFK